MTTHIRYTRQPGNRAILTVGDVELDISDVRDLGSGDWDAKCRARESVAWRKQLLAWVYEPFSGWPNA